MARDRYLVDVAESDDTTVDMLKELDADVYAVDGDSLTEADRPMFVRNTDLEAGDYAVDQTEPTPSPEVNTVKVVEVLDEPICEHTVGDSNETVYEYNNGTYPKNDRVVRGYYPNMSGEDKLFSFPASRLREV